MVAKVTSVSSVTGVTRVSSVSGHQGHQGQKLSPSGHRRHQWSPVVTAPPVVCACPARRRQYRVHCQEPAERAGRSEMGLPPVRRPTRSGRRRVFLGASPRAKCQELIRQSGLAWRDETRRREMGEGRGDTTAGKKSSADTKEEADKFLTQRAAKLDLRGVDKPFEAKNASRRCNHERPYRTVIPQRLKNNREKM